MTPSRISRKRKRVVVELTEAQRDVVANMLRNAIEEGTREWSRSGLALFRGAERALRAAERGREGKRR